MERRKTRAEGVREVVWIVAAALTVFVVWIAVGTASQGLGIGFYYLIPVCMASWWFGARWGLAAAAGCTGLYLAGAAIHTPHEFVLAASLRAIVFAAGALAVAALRSSRQRLRSSNAELEALRQALTPPALPELPGVDAAATFLPAEHGVAGDFYLMTNAADGAVVVVVGDVVGHGPEAANLATFARTSIVSFASNSSDPGTILQLANEALVERGRGGSEFVTALCATYRTADRTLSWATAGHHPPIRVPEPSELATESAPPLGLDVAIPLDVQKITLRAREGVLMFTDGLLEAPGDGERFGKRRLLEVLRATGAAPSARVVEAVRDALIAFSGNALTDDVCIVAVQAAE